jgi:hypothetical protein
MYFRSFFSLHKKATSMIIRTATNICCAGLVLLWNPTAASSPSSWWSPSPRPTTPGMHTPGNTQISRAHFRQLLPGLVLCFVSLFLNCGRRKISQPFPFLCSGHRDSYWISLNFFLYSCLEFDLTGRRTV